MKIMIFTASPNKDGLTAACGEAAAKGANSAGAETEIISLNNLGIGACKSCGNGWGTCLKENQCQVKDDFQNLHEAMKSADGYVFVSPVYWGEMSESAKNFTDRLRRCEAWKAEQSLFSNKPVICVAAAGGSGNGFISCLASMERFVMHTRGTKFDLIGITRFTREYKLNTICDAAKKMVEGISK